MIAISAASYYLPERQETVAHWCERHHVPGPSRVAIAQSGARSFRQAGDESVMAMAEQALVTLLARAPAAPQAVGAVVYFHTNASNALMPPQSMVRTLARRHGLRAAQAFSVSQQNCVSLLHALRLLEAMFGACAELQHAIVLGADMILREDMRVIDASAVHSDAAAALWISRDGAARMRAIATYNDPRFFRGAWASGEYEQNDRYFWSAVSVIRAAMRQAGIAVAQVVSLLPQNSNYPGWCKIAAALKLPVDKIYHANIGRLGHAFGADATINLCDSAAMRSAGHHILFASGLAGCFGALVIEVGAGAGAGAPLDAPGGH